MISEEELMDIGTLARQGYGSAQIGRLVGHDWRTVKPLSGDWRAAGVSAQADGVEAG